MQAVSLRPFQPQATSQVWEGEYNNSHQSYLMVEDKVRHQQLKDGRGETSWGLSSNQLRQSSKEPGTLGRKTVVSGRLVVVLVVVMVGGGG